jgi:hypothetical protein
VKGTLRRTLAPIIRPSRLLLAFKTALAAGLAWQLGRLLPGGVDEYSYYAPLGALISLTPTLMGSVRSTLQTSLGLVVGIVLAFGVIVSPLPGLVSVALAVGLGVVIGGLGFLGVGRDYVAVAALFVLVVGGSNADDFSLGYLAQMGLGMAIGVIVNLLIVPPLHQRESAATIGGLRLSVATNLEGIAAALREEWPPSSKDWFEGITSLRSSIAAAEPVIMDAYESRRLNPRARWARYDVQEDFDDLEALHGVSGRARDLGEAISSAIWGDPIPANLPPAAREPVAEAVEAAAALIRAWNEYADARDALANARRALERLEHSVTGPVEHGDVSGSIVFDLKRIVALVESRLREGSL